MMMGEGRDDRFDEGSEIHADVDLSGEGLDDRVFDRILHPPKIKHVFDGGRGPPILREKKPTSGGYAAKTVDGARPRRRPFFRLSDGRPGIQRLSGDGGPGSSLTPRATIRSAPSGSGRCSFSASSAGAVIQVSTSSGVVRITGIAFGWMAPTSAFGSVVRNA